MNVALFSDSYFPTKSGIVTVVAQLKTVLESLGHHVVVVTVSPTDESYEEAPDPTILRVSSINSPVAGQYIGIPHKKRIVDFLRKNNIQIIHAHTEFSVGHISIAVGKELGIPVIATTHTMWEDYYRYYLSFGKLISRRFIRKVVKASYKDFYAFINVSEKAHNYFKSSFMLPKTPSAVIPNAIDKEKFAARLPTEEDKIALKSRLGIKETDRVIMYVGRIVEEKRIVELLEILKRVATARDNVKVVFVGAGLALDELREVVENVGLQDKIIFTGFVDWFHLSEYYGIADIFTTASLSEMHSMTVLEALSSGVPIVCRKDDSFSDTVFNGVDGYMVDSDEAMGERVLELVDDADKCREMGKNAYDVSLRFSLDVHGRRTVAFYEKVLEIFPGKVTSIALKKAVDDIPIMLNQ